AGLDRRGAASSATSAAWRRGRWDDAFCRAGALGILFALVEALEEQKEGELLNRIERVRKSPGPELVPKGIDLRAKHGVGKHGFNLRGRAAVAKAQTEPDFMAIRSARDGFLLQPVNEPQVARDRIDGRSGRAGSGRAG